ncbi:MAG: hypothetical protein WDO16_00135 [Bacteroidota bacterium]
MKIIVADTYEELSGQAADDIIKWMQPLKDPLVCTASGDTPAGLYKKITEKIDKKELDISGWSFLGLDEWAGMNETDEEAAGFTWTINSFILCRLLLTGSAFSMEGQKTWIKNAKTLKDLFISREELTWPYLVSV